MGAEHRCAAGSDRDLVHLLDEGLQILTTPPRRHRLRGHEDLLRTGHLMHPDAGDQSMLEISPVQLVVERIPVHRFTVVVDGDASGTAVLEQNQKVTAVLVLPAQILVLLAG